MPKHAGYFFGYYLGRRASRLSLRRGFTIVYVHMHTIERPPRQRGERHECGGAQVNVLAALPAAKTVADGDPHTLVLVADERIVRFVFPPEARYCCVHDRLTLAIWGAGVDVPTVA